MLRNNDKESPAKVAALTNDEVAQVTGRGKQVSQSDTVHDYMKQLWQNADGQNKETQGTEFIIDGHEHKEYD